MLACPHIHLAVVSIALSWLVSAGSILPAYPLAVRSPYLSAWLPGDGASDTPSHGLIKFWRGQSLTWPVLARVNGLTYVLIGMPNGLIALTQPALQTGIEYSSTHTRVNLTAGPANLTLDYFSPVSPNDHIRQSLPYSYLTVSAAAAADTAVPVAVQILAAVDQTWSAQTGHIPTNLTQANATSMFRIHNPNEVLFSQSSGFGSDMATYGSVVWATRPTSSSTLTFACNSSQHLVADFVRTGSLSSASVPFTCAEGDLLAFSQDLGTIGHDPSGATFAIGLDRPAAINTWTGVRTGYYRSQYPDIPQAVSHFLDDYEAAVAESLLLDQLVVAEAQKVSQNYSDLAEAAVRQVFGAMELVIPADSMDTTKAEAYQKEISSGGKVNSIDVLLPTFPLLYVMAPNYIRFLLQAVLSFIDTGYWNLDYMIHDLGNYYPNATRFQLYDEGENMPLQESGCFMTMVHAYEQATGDKEWIKPRLQLLQTYADYLVKNGDAPPAQLATEDTVPFSPNQTNLAIQAAVGMASFGNFSGQANYTQAGQALAKMLYQDGLGLDKDRTHFTWNYGMDETWGVVFNSFADVLLDLGLFPSQAWEMQSRWYQEQMLSQGLPYAGGLDCGTGTTVPLSYDQQGCNFMNTDWSAWAGATSEVAVQQLIIDKTYGLLTNGLNNVAFPNRFNIAGPGVGQYTLTIARPTVGATWSILALRGTKIEVNSSTTQGNGQTGGGEGGASGTSATPAASSSQGTARGVHVPTLCSSGSSTVIVWILMMVLLGTVF